MVKRRQDYKKGKLSSEKRTLLAALPGWTWDPFTSDFEDGLARLRVFVAKEGHAGVPDDFTDNSGFPLGTWVGKRRAAYRLGKLSEERLAVLANLPGWNWNQRQADFEDGLAALRSFVAREGHAKVPASFVDSTGRRLSTWVQARRRDYWMGNLPPERIAALEAVYGWTWDSRATDYEEGLARLQAFVAKEGHSRVPVGFTDNTDFRLGVWAFTRRQQYTKGKLPSDKIAALKSLPGWSWDLENRISK